MPMPDNTTPTDPLTVTFTRDGTQEPHPLVPVPAEYLRAGHRTLPPAEYLEALTEARNGWFRVWGVAGAESPIPHAPCHRCGQLLPVVPGFDLPGVAVDGRGAVGLRYPRHSTRGLPPGQRERCGMGRDLPWDNAAVVREDQNIAETLREWGVRIDTSTPPAWQLPWWEALANRGTTHPDPRIGATLDAVRASPSDPFAEWMCPDNLAAWGMVPVSDPSCDPSWYAILPTEGVPRAIVAGAFDGPEMMADDGTLLWRPDVSLIARVMHEDTLHPPTTIPARTPTPFTMRRKGRPFPGIHGGVEALPAHVVTHSLAANPGPAEGNPIGGVSLYLHPLAFEVAAIAVWEALRSYQPGPAFPDTPLAVVSPGSGSTMVLTPRGEKRVALFLRRYLRVLGMFPQGPVCPADDATADRYIAEAWAIMQLTPNNAVGPVPALRAYLGPLVAAANLNAVIRE